MYNSTVLGNRLSVLAGAQPVNNKEEWVDHLPKTEDMVRSDVRILALDRRIKYVNSPEVSHENPDGWLSGEGKVFVCDVMSPSIGLSLEQKSIFIAQVMKTNLLKSSDADQVDGPVTFTMFGNIVTRQVVAAKITEILAAILSDKRNLIAANIRAACEKVRRAEFERAH